MSLRSIFFVLGLSAFSPLSTLAQSIAAPSPSDVEVWLPARGYQGGPIYELPNGALVATGESLLRSKDQGKTWSQAWVPGSQMVLGNALLSFDNSGWWISSDMGDHWVTLGKQDPRLIAASTAGALSRLDNSDLSRATLFTSSDDGASWIPSTTNPFTDSLRSLVCVTKRGSLLAIDHANRTLRESNGDWSIVSSFALDSIIESPTGLLYSFTDSTRRSLDDGATWQTVGANHAFRAVTALADGRIIGLSSEEVDVSLDSARSFQMLTAADQSMTGFIGNNGDRYGSNPSVRIDLEGKSALVVGGIQRTGTNYTAGPPVIAYTAHAVWALASNAMYKSTDFGNSWYGNIPANGIAGDSGGNIYRWSDSQAYRSNDEGQNWSTLPFQNVITIAVMPWKTVIAHVSEANQIVQYESQDNGASWSHSPFIDFGQILAYDHSGWLFSVTVDSLNDLHLKRSNDKGLTWEDIAWPSGEVEKYSQSIPQIAVARNGLAFLHLSGKDFYISNDHGKLWGTSSEAYDYLNFASDIRGNMYRGLSDQEFSSDNGLSWTTLPQSWLLPRLVEMYPAPSGAMFGTSDGSIARFIPSAAREAVRSSTTPPGATVFPNPATNEITISLLDRNAFAKSIVFSDITGNEISRVTIDGSSFKYDCHTLPSGSYTYRIIAGGRDVVSGSFVVVR